MSEAALGEVARQALSAAHVAQAELADVDAGQRDQLLRVRREVPRLDLHGMDDSIDDQKFRQGIQAFKKV